MVRYEILFLAVSEISSEVSSAIESNIRRAVEESKGSMISFERWGKYALQFPIKKRDYGVYFLVRFEFPEGSHIEGLQAVRNVVVLKYNEVILRHVVTRLPDHGSIAYQRPDSLEDVPAARPDTRHRDDMSEASEFREGVNMQSAVHGEEL